MKSILSRGGWCLLAALTFVASSASYAGTAYSKLVVFGDSLNDRGNMAAFTGGVFPNAPTYVYGRQTNGPVWVEYLAGRLGMADKVLNYAVVGALTAPAPGYPSGNVWSDTFPGLEGTDVAGQVTDYLGEVNHTADPAALHVLDGGANDFPRVADPAVIIPNLLGSFVRLQNAGAKHFLVLNLPDLGKTPRAILAELYGLLPPGHSTALYSALSAGLNAALATQLAAFAHPGVTVTIVDAHAFLNRIAANSAAYGFVNTQMPYLLAGGTSDPAGWLFWDDVHPTTRGHQLLAEEAITSLLATSSPRQGNGNGPGVVNALRGLVKAPGKG